MIVRDATFELLSMSSRDVLGEGPWWSVATEQLFWVDIRGHRVRRTGLNGENEREWATPSDVGFAVPDTNGYLLLGLRDGLHRLDPSTGRIIPEITVQGLDEHHRINDGKTDRSGRVWFGSMHDAETDATSHFFRYDSSGVRTVLDKVTTSNGLGWSPDNAILYHTDSMTRRITAYPFDAGSGHIGAGRVFAEDPDGYVPDGLTVDADGFVWGAKWDGGKVVRYAPDGRAVLELDLPVSRPTSCMFVGSDLRTLAVTSALSPRDDDRAGNLAGSVFLLDVGVQGLPEQPVSVHVVSEYSP